MSNPTLERGSKLHDDIERLQLALTDAGLEVDLDAMFGPGLEQALRRFQQGHGLKVDGVAGERTWGALEPISRYARPLDLDVSEQLEGFRGDIAWIHRWEGHAGRPYWPGGASGVTLDPGLDLGHADPDLVMSTYGLRLTGEQLTAARSVMGLKGEAAKAALDADRNLQGIRVLRFTATEVFPYVAGPYWQSLLGRFTTLSSDSTPGPVQTALLSLGYNRGSKNRALAELAAPLAAGDWVTVGELICGMQQDHSLEGIRRRRRAEGELILASAAN